MLSGVRTTLPTRLRFPLTRHLATPVQEMIEAEPRATLQSVDIRDAETLMPVEGGFTRPVVILLAVKFGLVPLIDHRVIEPVTAPVRSPETVSA